MKTNSRIISQVGLEDHGLPTFLGTVLKKVRKSRGVTQLQLAEKLGVTQATVARYEKGIMTPEVKRVTQIAKGLGVSVQEIFEEKEFGTLDQTQRSPGNSRQAKVEEFFKKLSSSDQKAILQTVEWLTQKKKPGKRE